MVVNKKAIIPGRKPYVGNGMYLYKNTMLSPKTIPAMQPHFVTLFQYKIARVIGDKTMSPENVVFTNVPIIPTVGS